jgi:hypothetical protein
MAVATANLPKKCAPNSSPRQPPPSLKSDGGDNPRFPLALRMSHELLRSNHRMLHIKIRDHVTEPTVDRASLSVSSFTKRPCGRLA